MSPLKLYVKDFACYEKGFIDFTEFSSALIVGKKESNDHYSNGVGKTTIFKAMEYVLFNQSDVPLERVVRDDTNACQVVLDFMIGDQEYRLARSRTRKGSTDLTLLQRNGKAGSIEEVYHSASEDPWIDKEDTKKYWKDLSGSRAGDTEKELVKLIKISHKPFVSTVLFPQNDMTGLPTVTPEKRKGILKEALNLLIYAKLEKIAKDRVSLLTKDLDKNKILFENLGDPGKELLDLCAQLVAVDQIISERNDGLSQLNDSLSVCNKTVNDLVSSHSNLESKFVALLLQEKSALSEKSKLEISVKEYHSKKTNITKAARELVDEINSLKETQTKLISLDYSQIDILGEKIVQLKERVINHNVEIKTNLEKYEESKIPLPSGSMCKTCRKPMSDEERKEHKEHIVRDMTTYQSNMKSAKQAITSINVEILGHQQNINSLRLSKQQLEGINTKIVSKNKEIQDKKEIHEEYCALLQKFTLELEEKSKELEAIRNELKNSSLEEANLLKSQIEEEKKKITTIMAQSAVFNKEISHYNSKKAVLQHTIDQKTKDKLRKEELQKVLIELEDKLGMFPTVLQAFSTTGIPNLIIQNVLDDLQVESNNLLAQLKPGIQLAFSVEKTVEKTGDQADTLDITYTVNGRERYYKQLSGAMQLAVAFSLKLGLSFLLQKMIGSDIKFLLLDEIDQSLDKASVDAFADIVKFFQKDFTILIITHNDRLKDKFSHAILVEQDINMVSQARVVSSW